MPTPITTTTQPTTSKGAILNTGDLSGFEVVEARLGGRELTLALANEPGLRSRGLMGVSDLGDLDGMLFTWGGATVTSRFTMRNTLIPLRIAFFDADGFVVSTADMMPCETEECPTYGAPGPYASAVELPAGTEVDPGARLELEPTR